jgi:hypothetical protein
MRTNYRSAADVVIAIAQDPEQCAREHLAEIDSECDGRRLLRSAEGGCREGAGGGQFVGLPHPALSRREGK